MKIYKLEEVRVYPCRDCNEGGHDVTHHLADDMVWTNKGWICEICEDNYPSETDLYPSDSHEWDKKTLKEYLDALAYVQEYLKPIKKEGLE